MKGPMKFPAAIMQTLHTSGLEPLEPYPGTMQPWRCRCTTCGQEIVRRYNDIQQQGGGCTRCVNRTADLTRIIRRVSAAGLQPLEPYPGSVRWWSCRCVVCGYQVNIKYDDIQQGRGGCRHCAGRCRSGCRCRTAA